MRHAIVNATPGDASGPLRAEDAGDEGEACYLPGVVAVFADPRERDVALAAIALRRAVGRTEGTDPFHDPAGPRVTPADWEIR